MAKKKQRAYDNYYEGGHAMSAAFSPLHNLKGAALKRHMDRPAKIHTPKKGDWYTNEKGERVRKI